MAAVSLVLSYIIVRKCTSKKSIVCECIHVLIIFTFLLVYDIKNLSTLKFHNKTLHINSKSLLSFILPRAHKIVYYGQLDNEEVVLKLIESKSYCSDIPSGQNCEQDCLKIYEGCFSSYDEQIQSLLLCPSVKGSADLLKGDAVKSLFFFGCDYIAHPLLIELLRKEDGWPVPKYYGRAGKTIIEENVGPMLSNIETESLWLKFSLSANLLRLADDFTFKHENFSFYFTDLSLDNIAVTKNNEPVLIDLDNVIIVDRRYPLEDSDSNKWNQTHVSQVFVKDAFSFSVQDICRHEYSDHNFFAVCAHILYSSHSLHNGLLQEIPDHIFYNFPNITESLRECAYPKEEPNRIQAGRKLLKLLESAISDSPIYTKPSPYNDFFD